MSKEKNYGLDWEREEKEQSSKDWEFELGKSNLLCATAGLKLKPHLPKGEVQRGREDFMDCATRAPINILETKFNALISSKRMSVGNIKWLEKKGYLNKNDRIEFSDLKCGL